MIVRNFYRLAFCKNHGTRKFFFHPYRFFSFCKNVVIKLHEVLIDFCYFFANLNVLLYAVVSTAHVVGKLLENDFLIFCSHFSGLVFQEVLKAVSKCFRTRVCVSVSERVDAFLPVSVLHLKRLFCIVFESTCKLCLPDVAQFVTPGRKICRLACVYNCPCIRSES